MIYLAALLALTAPAEGHASERFTDGRLSACVVSFDTGAVAGSFEVRDTVPGVPVAMLDLRTPAGAPSLAYLLNGDRPNVAEAITAPVPSAHGSAQFGFAIERDTAAVIATLMDNGTVRILYHREGVAERPVDVVLGTSDAVRMRRCVERLMPVSRL